MNTSLCAPERVDIVRRASDGKEQTVVLARLAGNQAVLAGPAADVATVLADAAERVDSRPEDGGAFLLALQVAYPPSQAAEHGAWVAVPRF